jgi:biotin carboxyl carrier protein
VQGPPRSGPPNLNRRIRARRLATMTLYELTSPDGVFDIKVNRGTDGFHVTVGDSHYFLKLKRGAGPNQFIVEVADKPANVTLIEASSQRVDLVLNGRRFSFQRPAAIGQMAPHPPAASPSHGLVTAPMPGRVIGTLVKKGEKVKAGDPLVILESMKMEIAVRSDRDAEVREILADEGSYVKRGQGLVRLV